MITSFLKRHKAIIECVKEFNDEQVLCHSVSPQGVGWNSDHAQITRYEQLLYAIPQKGWGTCLINDIGCGYGALWSMLQDTQKDVRYRGYDVSDGMLSAARQTHGSTVGGQAEFNHLGKIAIADYSVASGIFGMRFGFGEADWHEYVLDTLDLLNFYSRFGFAFNMLTSYSDLDKRKDELFYANPCSYFDICKRKYSLNVALLHDYGLYDFTIVVKKR